MTQTTLRRDVSDLWNRYENDELDADTGDADAMATLDAFLDALEAGEIRAAERRDGTWEANAWVKRGILLNFGLRRTEPRTYGDVVYHDVLALRETGDLNERGTRNTPDGTVIRRGSYVGANAILISPCFVNVGAYVDDGTLVDSCDTVGSCAQIGENVKLGANSVVGENTLLTPRIPVFDLVAEEVVYGELPPERRAFTRFVESSIGEHELIPGGAYKPAVVATHVEDETLEATRREEALRE